jgi:hypothetical protein
LTWVWKRYGQFSTNISRLEFSLTTINSHIWGTPSLVPSMQLRHFESCSQTQTQLAMRTGSQYHKWLQQRLTADWI